MNGKAGLRRGFTLIELLVVMSIIATLLMIAMPRYFQSLERAREATLAQDLAVMRDAIDKFSGDTGRYPESPEELVAQQYLRAIPVDPITRSADTWQFIRSTNADETGIRDVHSGADGTARSGIPYAQL